MHCRWWLLFQVMLLKAYVRHFIVRVFLISCVCIAGYFGSPILWPFIPCSLHSTLAVSCCLSQVHICFSSFSVYRLCQTSCQHFFFHYVLFLEAIAIGSSYMVSVKSFLFFFVSPPVDIYSRDLLFFRWGMEKCLLLSKCSFSSQLIGLLCLVHLQLFHISK